MSVPFGLTFGAPLGLHLGHLWDGRIYQIEKGASVEQN
jgi:hypothetical protein